MDDIRFGRVVRGLRRRLGWRQRDLAARAGVSQQLVSLVERGHGDELTLRSTRHLVRTLDAQVLLDLRWRGGAIDRLLDEVHASLVTQTTQRLESARWEPTVELTYAVYGERGSIDLVAWRAIERALLVIEVKSELTSAEAMLRKHDEKVRLAATIVAERLSWKPRTVSRLLVLPESTTSRRRVLAGGGLVARSYPVQGVELRRWLAAPVGVVAGLLFLPATNPRGGKRRIRVPRASM